jgi:MoaA/NifB/PqqE/SkfB family radical SAM enzyme
MTKEVFEKSIALAQKFDLHVTLGGGEPTLHPLFKDFLLYAQWELTGNEYDYVGPRVHLVTNGSNTKIALKIAELARMGAISAAVSHDEYHDPIDPVVYQAFTKPQRDFYHPHNNDDHDYRHINEGKNYIVPVGRAKHWGNHPFIKCICDSVFITPLGDVYPCGCKKTLLGNVLGEVKIYSEYFQGYCEKTQKKEYKENVLDAIAENL